jgi:hypothetical protein
VKNKGTSLDLRFKITKELNFLKLLSHNTENPFQSSASQAVQTVQNNLSPKDNQHNLHLFYLFRHKDEYKPPFHQVNIPTLQRRNSLEKKSQKGRRKLIVSFYIL